MLALKQALSLGSGKVGSGTPPPPPFVNTKSLAYDGVDDYMLIASGFKLGATTSSSAIWFKYNSQANTMFVSPVAPFNNFYYWIANNYMRIYHPLYGTQTSTTAWNIPNPNDWHHLVVTYDQAASEMKFYGDGVLKDTKSVAVPVHSGYSDVYVGRWSSSAWAIMQGNTDEMGNWSNVLTAAEVTEIYNNGTPMSLDADSGNYVSSSSLNGYWRFGDNDIYPTIQDRSGEGNNGTMINMDAGDIVTDVP